MRLKLNEVVVEVPDDVGQAAIEDVRNPGTDLHIHVTLPAGYSYTIKYPITLTEEK